MARNPVFLRSRGTVLSKTKSIAVEFTSLIVAVFKRISLEYTERISSLSDTQITVKTSLISSKS